MSEPDSHGPPMVYANWLRLLAAPYDLTLDLGYRVGDLEPKTDVRLVLSWEHAVAMRDAIDHAVENYQKATGESVRSLGGPNLQPAKFAPEQ
jgi:hypothetical protein